MLNTNPCLPLSTTPKNPGMACILRMQSTASMQACPAELQVSSAVLRATPCNRQSQGLTVLPCCGPPQEAGHMQYTAAHPVPRRPHTRIPKRHQMVCHTQHACMIHRYSHASITRSTALQPTHTDMPTSKTHLHRSVQKHRLRQQQRPVRAAVAAAAAAAAVQEGSCLW